MINYSKIKNVRGRLNLLKTFDNNNLPPGYSLREYIETVEELQNELEILLLEREINE